LGEPNWRFVPAFLVPPERDSSAPPSEEVLAECDERFY
jgi:hypothetical protein